MIYSEELLNVKLEMALLSSFGLIFGMTTSYKLNTHDYSPSQRIRISQLHSFCQTTPWRPSFISLSQNKNIKSFKAFKIIFKQFKFIIIQKILRNTFRETRLTLPQSSTISLTRTSSLLLRSSGFGIPDVPISSGYSPGFF